MSEHSGTHQPGIYVYRFGLHARIAVAEQQGTGSGAAEAAEVLFGDRERGFEGGLERKDQRTTDSSPAGSRRQRS